MARVSVVCETRICGQLIWLVVSRLIDGFRGDIDGSSSGDRLGAEF